MESKKKSRESKMTKIQIKCGELNSMFQQYGNLFEMELKMNVEDEDVRILMGEMNGNMILILSELGLFVDGEWLNWDSKEYNKVDWWLDLVQECYEGKLVGTNLWNGFFQFGGDDDVDYNSSYIFIVNEFLMWLWKRNLLDNYRIKESK